MCTSVEQVQSLYILSIIFFWDWEQYILELAILKLQKIVWFLVSVIVFF